jgi:hypothetical protein
VDDALLVDRGESQRELPDELRGRPLREVAPPHHHVEQVPAFQNNNTTGTSLSFAGRASFCLRVLLLRLSSTSSKSSSSLSLCTSKATHVATKGHTAQVLEDEDVSLLLLEGAIEVHDVLVRIGAQPPKPLHHIDLVQQQLPVHLALEGLAVDDLESHLVRGKEADIRPGLFTKILPDYEVDYILSRCGMA